MINHGIWETYIPQEAPLGAPNNAIYWTDGSRDWYEFSRENWSVVAGVDASGTTKVSIFNGFVSCVATDVTRMALFGKFLLLELEEGEDTPELGWKFEGGQFVKPTSPEPDASTIPITRRQLRLTLVRHGIPLASIEAAISAMPDGLPKEEAQIEWADASTFNRTHPTLLLIASALGLTEAKIDAMWAEAVAA